MSPRIALLILVLGSAAASTKLSSNFGSMIRCVRENTALALSRLPPDEMSTDGRDQSRGRSTAQGVGVYKHIWNSRKLFKRSLKWRNAGIEKKTQENNYRPKDRPVTELPKYWFKVCTKCPKHTWFLRNLEEKEAATEEAVRTTLIHKIVLKALEEASLKPPVIKPRSEEKIQQHCQLQN